MRSLIIRSYFLVLGLNSLAVAQMMPMASDAANWDTWIADADAIAAMVEAPSDADRDADLLELIVLAESRDEDTQAMVDYWNVVGAPYRWAEVLYDVSKDGPPGSRPFGLMSAAIYDAVVATAKAKEAADVWMVPEDSGVEPLAASYGSSFPSEHAAVAIAASEVLSYVYARPCRPLQSDGRRSHTAQGYLQASIFKAISTQVERLVRL